MDAQLIRSFRERWEAVAAIEAKEQREATVALRWRQLNAILLMSRMLELHAQAGAPDEQIVRRRWTRLKQAHK